MNYNDEALYDDTYPENYNNAEEYDETEIYKNTGNYAKTKATKKEPKDLLLENFNKNFDSITNKLEYKIEKAEDNEKLKTAVPQLITKLATIQNVTFDHALIGICGLLQSGSYLKSVSNRTIKISNIEFSKKNLLFAMDQIECKFTLRQIARYLKFETAKISRKYGIPGHLFSRFKTENALSYNNLSEETRRIYSAYCADFQLENPDTPPEIRQYLATREKTRQTKK
jgi:hypothetical protein